MKKDPFIDEDIEVQQNREDKAKEIENLFTEVFNTDAGKLVLSYISQGLESPAVAPEGDLYKIGVRDGRRDALHQIKKNIKG